MAGNVNIWCKQMEKEKTNIEQKEPEVDEHEAEDGYGSVDEDEKASVDTKEILSNPG